MIVVGFFVSLQSTKVMSEPLLRTEASFICPFVCPVDKADYRIAPSFNL